MILNNQQVIREFVKSRQLFYATEKLLQKSRASLDSSFSFEDMAFIVSKSDEELTPEEKSLLFINANVVSTNTDSDEIEFPHVISIESLNQTADKVVIASSNQFLEIWDNITTIVKSLTAINSVSIVETNNLIKLNTQAITDTNSLVNKEDSVMNLSSLPVELSVDKYSDNYIDALSQCTIRARDRISRSTVKTIAAIENLINSGLSNFSKESIRNTEKNIVEQTNQINSVVKIATEEITQNDDGTVITVLTDKLPENKLEEPPVVSTLLGPRIPINDQTLNIVNSQLQANLDLLQLSLQSCQLILDPKLSQAVKNFSEVAQKLLVELADSSRTKQAIKNYCDLFIQGINVANEEAAFMLKTTQFIICYNELLLDVIKHVSPSTQLKVV